MSELLNMKINIMFYYIRKVIKMKRIYIREKYVLEYIKNMLNCCFYSLKSIDAAKYHHNTSYEAAPSIIKYGILSMEDINNLGIKLYSKDCLNLMDDIESHVNGRNGVSLSVIGLSDLYKGEEEFNPYESNYIDFLVDSNIKAFRNTIHYGNEFISEGRINSDKIKAADIRLIKYIDSLYKKDIFSIIEVINKYNQIIMMSKEIVEAGKDIQIREMSDGVKKNIDVIKMSKTPKLILKI